MATLKLALPQLAPCWLDRDAGLNKVVRTIEEASRESAELIVFSEAFLPGYPFWLSVTGGAAFDDDQQKEWFAWYSDQAIQMEAGHLDPICEQLRKARMACYLGVVERAGDRSGHSLYCSYVFINAEGEIRSIQRKLQPTYEERLVWAHGDGAGLVTHAVGPFTVGGLNCWENWMPLTRAALYAAGEDLHVAGWPGSLRNTADLTPILAREGRSFAVSVSAIMRAQDISDKVPAAALLRECLEEMPADGGSCVAGPDGRWVLEPVVGVESLRYCDLDPQWVRRERQNFDPAGHYSRPDVTRLIVNRKRQRLCEYEDD